MITDGFSNRVDVAGALRWTGAAGIAAVALMRTLTAFAPQVYFDLDPAIDPSPLAALSPAGSLWLDALLLLACAIAFVGEALAGRGIEWKLLTLAALPAPVILWHGWHDLGDLWRGSTWLAAVLALVAAAHLARDRLMRLVLLCVLIAIAGPLLVRGLSQVTIEHAATVAEFERTKERFLRDRGWEPGSPSALIYERRLRQPQPTGWFATTNIYGSVMAAALIVLLGLTIGALRLRRFSAWTVATAMLAVLALIALYLTGSKGALLAALAGAAVLVALTLPLVASHLRRYAPHMLIALIPLALLGVVVRGVLLPEDFLGDRSLLFRWHYLVSSLDIFRNAPLLGVGPDGYQQAYTMFRLPRNPEEVASAHSVFIDWLCTLGVLSIAWIAVVFAMLWRAGRACSIDLQNDSISSAAVARIVRTVAAGVVILGIFPAILVEQHVLGGEHFMLRVLGVVAFLAIAAVMAMIAERADRMVMAASIAVAAAVLLVHGQIEMTFYQPGSVVWAMCVLGVAGGNAVSSRTNSRIAARRRASILVPAAMLGALALWIAITGARPATVQASRMAQASHALYPQAEDAPGRIEQRRVAASILIDAYEAAPTNALPLHAAIRQREIAAAYSPTAHGRAELLTAALALADRAVESHRHSAGHGIRTNVSVQLYFTTGERAHLDRAIIDLRRITEFDPHGILPWHRLGDVLWLAGRREDAAMAYERALENDANFVLDPLKRLPEPHRELLRERIREVPDAGRAIAFSMSCLRRRASSGSAARSEQQRQSGGAIARLLDSRLRGNDENAIALQTPARQRAPLRVAAKLAFRHAEARHR